MTALLSNFSWGNGPYCRAVQLALLSAKSEDKIIIPLVYGDRQKRILKEETPSEHQHRLHFDEIAGGVLKELMFSGNDYFSFLKSLIEKVPRAKDRLQEHFSNQDLRFCVGRNSLFALLPGREVSTSFVSHADLFAASAKEEKFKNHKNLLEEAATLFAGFQKEFSALYLGEPCIALPQSVDYQKVPPLVPGTKIGSETPTAGQHIYVTVSGLDKLEKSYEQLPSADEAVLSKKIGRWQGQVALPDILSHPQFSEHWARPSWNAIWSMITLNKPLFCLPAAEGDDPEMYWNKKTLEELGLYCRPGQRFPHDRLQALREELIKKYGDLKGLEYSAKKIATLMNC